MKLPLERPAAVRARPEVSCKRQPCQAFEQLRCVIRNIIENDAKKPRHMSGSAERLVDALEAVSANPEGVSVTEAARTLGMSKAAASRLLASLATAGLMERDSAQRLRIADISRSLLLQTANDTGTRLHISVLRGTKAFFLEMTDFSQARAI